jgi:hypothetical protein
VGLIIVSALLTRKIVHQLGPTVPHRAYLVVLSLMASAVFVLDNLVHVQVNLLTLVLCLIGVQAFIEKRELAAGGWFVSATALKITPIFFLVWALVRGSRRSAAAIAIFGTICLGLPMVQRGFAQGTTDLLEYYHSFLQEFTTGRVVTVFRNQNLAGMIYRAFIPGASADVPPFDYAYLPSLGPAAAGVYRVAVVLLLALFLSYLFRRRMAHEPVAGLEICSVFLVSHLLSGITWKAHLVSFLFISYVFFSLRMKQGGSLQRWSLWLAWAGIFVIGLGRDVLGSKLHHYMGGYSLYVWVMLFLFILSIAWSRREQFV